MISRPQLRVNRLVVQAIPGCPKFHDALNINPILLCIVLVFSGRPKAKLAIAINAFVTSHFDYCDATYLGLSLETIWKFELMQSVLWKQSDSQEQIELVLHNLH